MAPGSAPASEGAADAAGSRTTGVILCGGRGTRLGGLDKPLETYRGRPLVAHVADLLRPQVASMLISANRNEARYALYGRVIRDRLPGFAGPLSGLDAAMAVAETPLLFVCPGDGPGLPGDLVRRLEAALGDADAAVAHDGVRRQPLFLLVRTRCRADLTAYLDAGGSSVHGWLEELGTADVRVDEPEAFRNLNEPEDFRTS